MSTRPVDAPPPGEHIHLPGPSYQPIIVTLGLMGMLIGILEFPFFGAFCGIVMVAGIVFWVRDAAREYRELPASHD